MCNNVFRNKNECFGTHLNDSSVCTGHGECVDENKCKCECGYFGDKCQLEKTKKWKKKHCADKLKSLFDFTCDNLHYYDPIVCNNNGICVEENECICDYGFKGKYCQKRIWFSGFYCFNKKT